MILHDDNAQKARRKPRNPPREAEEEKEKEKEKGKEKHKVVLCDKCDKTLRWNNFGHALRASQSIHFVKKK